MSAYFRELVAVSGISFIIMGRYIIYAMFPVFLKGTALYLFDIKGLWRTILSSLLTQFFMVGAGGIIAMLANPELDIFAALDGTGLENTALPVLITFIIVYLAADAAMIWTTDRTLKTEPKRYIVIISFDLVNIFMITLMFSHQIIITI